MNEHASGTPRRTAPMPYRSARTPSGWQLPDGARVAVWVIPNVEFFPLDEDIPGGRGRAPDVPAFAKRDYGGRVGFWRVFDALAEHEVPPTTAFNREVLEAYPEVVAAMVEARWEFMGHCNTNNRLLSEMSAEEEARTISEVAEGIEGATGTRPRGWLGAGLHERWTTLQRLDEAGYTYVADWVNDDRPNTIEGTGLTSVPYSTEINDKPAFETWRMQSDEFADMALRQFEVLWRDSAQEPRVFAIALHPYLIGVPHRIDALRRLLAELRTREGVWWATGSQIEDCYRQTRSNSA